MIHYARQSIDAGDMAAVQEVLKSDFLTTGPAVRAFEEALCDYCGARFGVAVSSGTAALHLAALLLLQEGDTVITTPNSFVATANAILYAGAKPLFVDIKEDGNIDLDQVIAHLEHAQTPIKALFAVHFSGHPVDMQKLAYIRTHYGIKIVEDAAHAIGSRYEEGHIGDCRYSDLTTFSFHPVKNITSAEGGALLTNDATLYHKALLLRNHGIEREHFQNQTLAYDAKGHRNPWYYEMQTLGLNYRLSDLHAALGHSQLRRLHSFIAKRQALAQRYDEAFANTPIRPLYAWHPNSSYHLYCVRIDFSQYTITKAELFERMRARGFGLQLHYIPIYKQPFYQKLGYGHLHLKQTEKYYEEVLTLPLFYDLKEKRQAQIIQYLQEALI